MRVCKCEINPRATYYARTMRGEVVGHDKMLAYAQRHKMLYVCDDCSGVIADYRPGGRGLRSSAALKRPTPLPHSYRQPRERTAVIRSLGGSGVDYRYFGESYGLRQAGVDLSKAEGFKGSGSQLAKKLGVTEEVLAGALKVPVSELRTKSYDISKD